MSIAIVNDFNGTAFATVGSWATPAAITNISNASTAVVTSAGHTLVDGDVIKLDGLAGQLSVLNGLVFAVNVLTADTYELIRLNTLNLGVYTSGGTAAKGVFVDSCQVTGYTGDTGQTPVTTTDTNCTSVKSFGNLQHGQVALPVLSAATPYVEALTAAYFSQEQTALRYTLKNNRGFRVDIGVVTAVQNSGAPGGSWAGGFTLERVMPFMDFA